MRHNPDEILWSRDVGPSQTLAFSRDDLPHLNVAPLPFTGSNVVEVHFKPVRDIGGVRLGTDAGGILLQRHVEANLFVRDPTESYSLLIRLGDNEANWLFNTAIPGASQPPYALPNSIAIPYPIDNYDLLLPIVVRPLWAADFWAGVPRSDWAGPGIAPDGYGAIKAIDVLQHGLCAQEIALADIVPRVAQSLALQFLAGICTDDPEDTRGEIEYVDTVSYLFHGRRSESDLSGGFLLHTALTAFDRVFPLNLSPCTVSATWRYLFELVDGRLGVSPAATAFEFDTTRLLCTGPGGNSGFARRISDALDSDVPKGILDISTGLQSFTRDDSTWNCDPKTDNPCAAAGGPQLQFGLLISKGVEVLGITDPTAPTRLKATVNDPRNWRCAEQIIPNAIGTRPDVCTGAQPEKRNRCEYIIRAKRLNAMADAVELVFFDQVDEYDNPAFALFVASFFDPATSKPNFNAYQQLCKPTRSAVPGAGVDPFQNFFVRPFVASHIGHAICGEMKNPPVCPCVNDVNCQRTAACVAGHCADLCNSTNDCYGPRGGICFGGRCINQGCKSSDDCPKYEYCDQGLCRLPPSPGPAP